jgi:hypothetical protein
MLVLFALTVGSCTGPERLAPPIPDVARFLCTVHGPKVLTPVVRARPDGVHFEIENRADRALNYGSVTGPSSGRLEPGQTVTVVESVGPGRHEVYCDGLQQSPPRWRDNREPLRVVDLRGMFVSGELEGCDGGTFETHYFVDPTQSKYRGPADEATHEMLRLAPSDIVQRTGYPEADSWGYRVVRQGRTVVVLSLTGDETGWSIDWAHGCVPAQGVVP